MERENTTRFDRENTAFLMMWINPEMPELDDVHGTVQEVFKSFNIKATRADEIEHEGIITSRVIEEIKTSNFLFADLTGERPSVYYEIGYAHAIGKPVILFRKKGTRIHFDLAAYNCPEYENLGDLRKRLTRRLEVSVQKHLEGTITL
jgi:nucleoside 2-deoxyribosyltransferase